MQKQMIYFFISFEHNPLYFKNLIHKSHIGIFENKTGKTNVEELETQVNKILNQAASDAGKIGRNSLDKDNRFVIMVNAGSKGSDLNISQMIACIGQQNIDGQRITHNFKDRTLPHYKKYDDNMEPRGFIENSFILPSFNSTTLVFAKGEISSIPSSL